jgi:hypothetical protein
LKLGSILKGGKEVKDVRDIGIGVMLTGALVYLGAALTRVLPWEFIKAGTLLMWFGGFLVWWIGYARRR